jgi:hypothetical protein
MVKKAHFDHSHAWAPLIYLYLSNVLTGERMHQRVREEEEEPLASTDDYAADNGSDADIYPSNMFCF